MIVLAVALSSVVQLVVIAMLVWNDVRHTRAQDRLVNLLAAKSPHEFAVIQRASATSAPAEDKPAEPKPQPIGLS